MVPRYSRNTHRPLLSNVMFASSGGSCGTLNHPVSNRRESSARDFRCHCDGGQNRLTRTKAETRLSEKVATLFLVHRGTTGSRFCNNETNKFPREPRRKSEPREVAAGNCRCSKVFNPVNKNSSRAL